MINKSKKKFKTIIERNIIDRASKRVMYYKLDAYVQQHILGCIYINKSYIMYLNAKSIIHDAKRKSITYNTTSEYLAS